MHVSEMVCKVMVKAFRAINKLKILDENLEVFIKVCEKIFIAF